MAMSSKPIEFAKGADVVSAATTTIWVADGNFIHVTGATGPITSFGTAPQIGSTRIVIFDSTPTITHNATSLILPTGPNIVAAAGDCAVVVAETTANARVVAYFRKDGTQVATASLLQTNTVVTLSDGATPALNAALGNTFVLTAAGDRTIAVPSNPVAGQKITIIHIASGGARTLALNTGAGGFRYGADITALTQTTSGKTDYIGCICNSAATYFDVVSYTKGF